MNKKKLIILAAIFFSSLILYCIYDLMISHRSYYHDSAWILRTLIYFTTLHIDYRVPRLNDVVFQFLPLIYVKSFADFSLSTAFLVADLSRYLGETLIFIVSCIICMRKKAYELLYFILLIYFGFYLVLITNPGGYVQSTLAFSTLLFVIYVLDGSTKNLTLSCILVALVGLGYQTYVIVLITLTIAELVKIFQLKNYLLKRSLYVFVSCVFISYIIFYLVNPNTPMEQARNAVTNFKYPIWAYAELVLFLIGVALIFFKERVHNIVLLTGTVCVTTCALYSYIGQLNEDMFNVATGHWARIFLSLYIQLGFIIYISLNKLKKSTQSQNFNLYSMLAVLFFLSLFSSTYLIKSDKVWSEGLAEIKEYHEKKLGCIDVPTKTVNEWQNKYKIHPTILPMLSVYIQNSRAPETLLMAEAESLQLSQDETKHSSCGSSYNIGVLEYSNDFKIKNVRTIDFSKFTTF